MPNIPVTVRPTPSRISSIFVSSYEWGRRQDGDNLERGGEGEAVGRGQSVAPVFAYIVGTTFHRVEKISAIELPRGREGRLS